MVKFAAIPNSIQADEIASNTCSDTMASKVCPVCKTFTSTSNTTLNAHIDQCLSSKSYVKRDFVGSPKLEVKKKKKRLMVDIYATAQHCTLEDLDRRNGTNWAVELTSWAVPFSEVDGTACKKPKLMHPEHRAEVDDKEVYVDSNGVKLRVLCKSTETTLSAREEPQLRKVGKDKKVPELNNVIGNHKQFRSRCSKKMEMINTMETSSFKLSKTQIQAGNGRDCDEENRGTYEETNVRMQVNNCQGSSFRRWVCSKSSDVVGKLPSKIADSCETGDYKSLARIYHKKILKASKESLNSPKTIRVDFLYSGNEDRNERSKCPVVASEAKFPPKRLVLKLSRSHGTPILIKDKLYVHKQIAKEFDKASNMSWRPLETRTASTPKKKKHLLQETRKSEAIGQHSSSEMFRKRRSFPRTSKRVGFRSYVDQGLHCNQSPNSGITSKKRTEPSLYNREVEGKENMDISALDGEEHEQTVSGNELYESHLLEKLQRNSDQKDLPAAVVSRDDIGSLEMADKAKTKENWDVQSLEFQENSCRLTISSNLGTGILQRSSSTSISNLKGHELDLDKDEELTASPDSTISLSFPVETNCIVLEEPVRQARSRQDNPVVASESLETVRDFEENTEEVCVRLPVEEHSWLNDDGEPLCGSFRSRDTKMPRETDNSRTVQVKQTVPNLFERPRNSSSFTAYQSRRTDTAPSSNFGSKNQEISTNNLNDRVVNYPTHTDTSSPNTPSQSNSNSILRLMGKNLLVTNNEELVHHQSSALDYLSARNSVQADFSAACSLSDTMGCHQMPVPVPMTTVGSFAEPQFASGWTVTPDYLTQQKDIRDRIILPRANYMTNGVIMIDDSRVPGAEMNGCLTSPTSTLPIFSSGLSPFPLQPFSYYHPLQSQAREVSSYLQPLYPSFYSSVSPTNFRSRELNAEVPRTVVPGHIVFRSPMGSSVYYSHTML